MDVPFIEESDRLSDLDNPDFAKLRTHIQFYAAA